MFGHGISCHFLIIFASYIIYIHLDVTFQVIESQFFRYTQITDQIILEIPVLLASPGTDKS